MIFLTIGTHEPFERLVRAVDTWAGRTGRGDEVFGQITAPKADAFVPTHFEWIDRLSPVDYAARFAASKLIVSHAGMGSIITALQSGKPIVVMPRRGHLRETRNDHQYTTVRNLGARPGIHVAEDETQIDVVMDEAVAALGAPETAQISAYAEPRFTTALRNFMLQGKTG